MMWKLRNQTRAFTALLAGVSLWTMPATHAGAVTGCAADAMLVFDGSASMQEIGFDASLPTRIEDARDAVHRAMPQIAPFRRIGLLVYGPGGTDSCNGIELRFAPVADASGPVIAGVDAIAPKGLTPLTASVLAAAETLDYENQPGVVVLVTDGNETCGGRPCALGAELVQRGYDLTVHVIGFKVVSDFFSWDNPEATFFTDGSSVAKCLSDQTGGMYVSTKTVDELSEALQQTLGCALIGHGPNTLGVRRHTG